MNFSKRKGAKSYFNKSFAIGICFIFQFNNYYLEAQEAVNKTIALPVGGLCAHRGAMETHPENTLIAFREAVKTGAHMIEFDVWTTKDNELVVIHDASVDRTTDGTGKVSEFTLAEIKKLDAGSWKSPEFSGERIPTLQEVLNEMPVNIWLNVHLKAEGDTPKMVAKLLEKENRLHQAFLACSAKAASLAKSVVPEIMICNMERQNENWDYVKGTIDMKADFIQLRGTITPEFSEYAKTLKKNGIKVNYFGTDSPDEIKALFDYGIDFPLVNDIVHSIKIAEDMGIQPVNPIWDLKVQQKLEQWQDLKFGLFMHWGAYSQWGIVESWSLCNEDRDWIKANRPEALHPDYGQYKKDYKNLQKTFNPVGFNPQKWVKAARDAGMKYLVFTTKHHDGFCMFDTNETDYKITSQKCPFHVHPSANVTQTIFNAFREENFMVGAYFSKPDWNSEYFWWPYFATPDRNANYDPLKYPERWQKFKNFTYNQIEELMTGYGSVDILWLDGGWVNPSRNNQDIDMPSIAEMARKNQPGIIIVDRGQKGPYTNYLTPEQHIPEDAILSPWESCITMGNSWSYRPADQYKTARELVYMLVDIVAKGGNFLLNIGPGPDGDFDPVAYQRLKEIGSWIKVNGEAIYATKPVEPYKYNNVCLTSGKNTKAVYAIYMEDEKKKGIPSEIEIKGIKGAKNAKLTLLGKNGNLKWKNTDTGIKIFIPDRITKSLPCEFAWTVKISEVR